MSDENPKVDENEVVPGPASEAPDDPPPSADFLVEHLRVRTFSQLADHIAHHRADLEELVGPDDNERIRMINALEALFVDAQPSPLATFAKNIGAGLASLGKSPEFVAAISSALGSIQASKEGHSHSPDAPNIAAVPETPAEAVELTDENLMKALRLLTEEYNRRIAARTTPPPEAPPAG